jgi:hypothetical protein
MRGKQPHALTIRSNAVLILALLGMMLLPATTAAQPQVGPGMPNPRLLVAMPSGGKAGTTVEVTLTGLDLEDPESLLFSQPGIKAEPIKPPPPDPKKPVPPPTQPVTVKFKVTIPADTPLGSHDVRLINKWGVSNPRAFVVGDLDEVLEKEPNNDIDQAQRVELNTTINGAISAPTDVDYFSFAGKKGQCVVVSCLASSIDSRLSAALQLFDSSGRLLAFNRNYSGNDALLNCSLPTDGDYLVRVYAFTYTQGSPEHFYRLSITTAPWIDAIFPPMVEPGKQAKLTVYGRNLPGGKPDSAAVVDGQVLEKITVTVDAPKEPLALQQLAYGGQVSPKSSSLDGFEYRVHNDAGTSNPFLLTYAQAPVVLDNQANDDADSAQEVTLPCEIAGQIEKKRDRDWYTFKAEKGDVYSIEAYGDRLGSPLALRLVLRNTKNKQVLGEFEDNPDILGAAQFFSRTEDPPRFRFVVPADGQYQLMVTSREAPIQAGPRDFYRIRIAHERPDFRLVLMPQTVNGPDACVVHQRGHQFYTVFAWRLDGFAGDIALSAEGLPEGITCSPQTMAAGLRQATLVLSAAANAPHWTGPIKVKGTATINGQTVVREARAATITWPAPQNTASISRLDRSLMLAVRDKALFSLNAGIDKAAVLPGEKVTVPIKLVRHAADFKAPVLVTALNLPPNLTFNNNNQPVPLAPGKEDASLVLDVKANVQPGTYTIVFRGLAIFPFSKDPTGKQPKQNLTAIQPSTPITITVLPKQVATVSVTPGNATVKVGKQAEFVVKVARQYDYAGEFKLEVVLPPGEKGISAEESTIPKGKDEAKIVLKVAPGTGLGNRANLIVRATAMVNGKVPTTQEGKFSVNVVK